MRTEGFRSAGIPACFWPILTAIVVLAAVPTQAQTLNRNLVVNGGAEDGPAVTAIHDSQVSSDSRVGRSPARSRWAPTTPRTFPSSSDYGSGQPGEQAILRRTGTDHSFATQIVDVSGAASDIDAGRVKFYLLGLPRLTGRHAGERSVHVPQGRVPRRVGRDAAGSGRPWPEVRGGRVASASCCAR